MSAGHTLLHDVLWARDIPVHRTWTNTLVAATISTTSTMVDSAWVSGRPTGIAGGGPRPVVFYPTGQPTINNIDAIQVLYDTVWTDVHLTLMCELDPEAGVWSTAEFEQLARGGSIVIAPDDTDLDISNFPADCQIVLQDSENPADAYTGGQFTMTSTQGVASLYALSATTVYTPSTTGGGGTDGNNESNDNDSGQNPSNSSGGSDTSNTSGTGTNAAGGASETGSSASNSTTSESSSGLSGGAKAGVAIGVILSVLALFAILFFFFRSRRRRGVRLKETGDNLSEKIVTALPPAPVVGEDTVIPSTLQTTQNRNSEEWRTFFGNASVRPNNQNSSVASTV